MTEPEYSAHGLSTSQIEVSLNARKGRPRRFTPEELASSVKHCRTCDTVKPKTEFGTHNRYSDGLQAFCKECINARSRQRRKGWSPEERKRRLALGRVYHHRSKDAYLERNYGLSTEGYQRLLEQQEGRCAICRRTGTVAGRAALCVDHDHTTGEVRGLLCMRCNTALGGFKDSADMLVAALGYLNKG